MFATLLLAAKGSGEASVLSWYCSLVTLCFAGALLKRSSPELALTPLAAGVVFFAAWITGTNFSANPSYTVVAPFHAALLLGGFLLGRLITEENLPLLFGVGLVFGVALALGALGLQFAQTEARAHSLFVTPATLASALNLFLLPALIVAAFGNRRFTLLVAIFLLSAAFTGAQSRGGWVALAVAVVFAFLFARHTGLALEKRDLMRSAVAFALGVLAWWITASVWMGAVSHAFVDEAVPSLRARLDLYALAWRGIQQSSLLYGAGYQAFFYLLESAGGSIAHYAGRTTYFVHNDYLQVLLELGMPGLGGLVFLVAAPIVLALGAAPAVPAPTRIALLAVTAAIVSMAVHALADFPFYIPLCALVLGALLGLDEALVVRSTTVKSWTVPASLTNAPAYKGIRAGVAVIIFWLLSVPVVAEVAASHAFSEWRQAHSENAAFWFEVARRLEPRDWRYHWYAGQFWLAQAEQSQRRDAAQFADSAFAKGYAANPREGRALFGRLVTNSKLRTLLEDPADAATMLGWADRIAELAPLDSAVLEEHALIRRAFGSK